MNTLYEYFINTKSDNFNEFVENSGHNDFDNSF